MADWLEAGGSDSAPLALGTVALRLAASVVTGLVVASVYSLALRKPAQEGFPLRMTLVLLTVLVAMTTLVIGDNVARAFSLVGALAIVRFRTVVEDTRDTAFVIFAVIAGMGIGAGHFGVCAIGVPAASAVALAMGAWSRSRAGSAAASAAGCRLLVRVGLGHEPEALLGDLWSRHLASCRLAATATARQGAALDLRYVVRLRDPARPLALVQELSRLEGVQHVELESA